MDAPAVIRIIFVLGAVLRRALGSIFSAIVILTLGPADVARIGLLNSGLVLIANLAPLNSTWGLDRLAFTSPVGPARDAWFAACVRMSLIGLMIGIPVGLAVNFWLGDQLQAMVAWKAVAIAIAAVSSALLLVVMTWFRVQGRLTVAASYGLAQGLITLLAYMALWWWHGPGYASVLIAVAAGNGIPLLPLVPEMMRRTGPEVGTCMKRLAAFSTPTLPHLLGSWALLLAPRWCGAGAIGLAEMAYFTVVSQVYGTCSVISRATLDVHTVPLGEAFARGDLAHARAILRRAQWRILPVHIGVHVLAWAAILMLTPWLPAHAHLGATALAWSAVISVLDSFCAVREKWLYGQGKTSGMTVPSLASAGICIGMIVVLVGQFGSSILLPGVCAGFACQVLLAEVNARRHGWSNS